MSTLKKTDIVIVGAGPAGLSMACALASSRLNIVVIDKQSMVDIAEPAIDGREIALTHFSKKTMTDWGVWQRLPKDHVFPLQDARVQDGPSPYELLFKRDDDPVEPLGYMVANQLIRRALHQQVAELNNVDIRTEQEVLSIEPLNNSTRITLRHGEFIEASLVVAADSRFSETRRMVGISAKMKDFGRVMIVANMQHQLSNNNSAQECFFYDATGAILPMGEKQSSIVTTLPASRATELTSLPADAFAHEMESMFNQRLGKMELSSKRYCYPLVGVYADRFIAGRFAAVGDAAVGMHPVTAHGYNLAVHSVTTLGNNIAKAKESGRDIGSQRVLLSYEARHQLLAKPIYNATNLIVKLYSDSSPIARLARRTALRAGNHVLPFKKLVVRQLTQTG